MSDPLFNKLNSVRFHVMPNFNNSDTVVAPYNVMLSIASQLNHNDSNNLCVNFDNQKLYQIYERLGNSDPTLYDINRLIAMQITDYICTDIC